MRTLTTVNVDIDSDSISTEDLFEALYSRNEITPPVAPGNLIEEQTKNVCIETSNLGDWYKVQHFIKVMTDYPMDEIERLLPPKPFFK